MEKKKQLLMNFLLGLVAMIFLYIIITFFPVYKIVLIFFGKLFLPFVLAAFISYLIYPLLEKMMAYRIPPFWSIVILFLLFIGIFLFLCYKSFPSFIDELEELSKQLPYLLEQYESMIYQVYESTSFLPEAV